jgi:hypothetical protein
LNAGRNIILDWWLHERGGANARHPNRVFFDMRHGSGAATVRQLSVGHLDGLARLRQNRINARHRQSTKCDQE